jgi:RNA polymerase sigma factor (sigma-70 family)
MSTAKEKDFVLTDYAKNLIPFKSKQLSKRRDLGHVSREDIEQELWLAVVAQADRFDPDRASLDTYLDRIVSTAAAMVLRDRDRQKRGNGHRTVSLDATTADSGRKTSLAETIADGAQIRRLGRERRDDAADREQREAVESGLAAMPPEVSDVCRRVMGGSISSAADELGTTRRQVRNVLAEARPFVEDAGIDSE